MILRLKTDGAVFVESMVKSTVNSTYDQIRRNILHSMWHGTTWSSTRCMISLWLLSGKWSRPHNILYFPARVCTCLNERIQTCHDNKVWKSCYVATHIVESTVVSMTASTKVTACEQLVGCRVDIWNDQTTVCFQPKTFFFEMVSHFNYFWWWRPINIDHQIVLSPMHRINKWFHINGNHSRN